MLRKYDVKVAIENLFGITTLPSDDYDYSLNSRTSEMLRVINMLNDMAGEERFVACVDTGHALVMGQDPAKMIRALGNKFRRFTGGKSRNFRAADGGKDIARRAAELCGVALRKSTSTAASASRSTPSAAAIPPTVPSKPCASSICSATA